MMTSDSKNSEDFTSYLSLKKSFEIDSKVEKNVFHCEGGTKRINLWPFLTFGGQNFEKCTYASSIVILIRWLENGHAILILMATTELSKDIS